MSVASLDNSHAPGAQQTRKPLILLVDDDTSVHIMGEAVLRSAGFNLLVESSGQGAIDAVLEHSPDLILLDIMMPGIDGFETCETIKSNPASSDIPVIMLTGNDDIDSVQRAYACGAWDFTSKPINWPVLVNRCWHTLEASRAFVEARKAARLSSILDNAQNDIFNIDVQTLEVVSANESATAKLSDTDSCFIGRPVFDLIIGFDRLKFESLTAPLLTGEPQVSFNGELRRVDGSTYMVEGLILMSPDDKDGDCFVAILQDVSERLEKEKEVYNLQFFDALTGLPNRLLMRQRIEQELTTSRRNNSECAIALIDLDGFKIVNDALGHTVGDGVLRKVAATLEKLINSPEYQSDQPGVSVSLGRLGGDEFLLLISDYQDRAGVRRFANSVLSQFEQPMIVADQEITLTGSIGISVFPQDGDSIDELIKNADTAMYESKSAGKNTFRFCNDTDSETSLEKLTTESQLRRAILQDELRVHYQVQVDNETGEVLGLEALVRWQHPERGSISPGLFIPIAEETSLIIDIGNWVIQRVLQDSNTWLSELLSPEVEIAINISNRHLQHEDFVPILKKYLAQYQPFHKVVIEVTESSVMNDTDAHTNRLDELRRIGLEIAIDDFGTGYSSLSYLKNLPVDTLKVDQSFVKNIENDELDLSIVQVIFNLAKMLGLRVVAEGVETEQQARLLSGLGPHLVQGYLVSRPLPEKELITFLSSRQTADAVREVSDGAHHT